MIKDLPITDKPREKAISNGIDNLTDAELLAILLRTGTKNTSALDLAHQIIKEYGKIGYDNTLSLARLCSIDGIGPTKAITILSAIELGKRSLKPNHSPTKFNSSKDIYLHFKYLFYNEKQEILIVVFLDAVKHLINYKKIYIGTNNNMAIRINDIFKEAYLHSSSKLVLLHNHPSGINLPSKNDYMTTNSLVEAGEILQIKIIDHIIITNYGYYSFYDNGDI